MEILLAAIAGAAIGVAAHFLITGRDTRGVLVAPMLGAIGAAGTWTAMTWAGIGTASPLIWLVAPAAGVVAATVPTLVLAQTRAVSDSRAREALNLD